MKRLLNEENLMFMALMTVLVLAVLALMPGCAGLKALPPEPSSPPSGAQPTPPLSPNSYGFLWDSFVQDQLTGSPLLQANLSGLCKTKIDPRRFWGGLVRSLVYGESYEWRKSKPLYGKVDPACVYTENFKDGLTGELAQSVGLLQLSVGDKLGYKTPNCQSITNQSLKEPTTNLACGLEIMVQLIKKYGDGPTLQSSLGRYWSTIRKVGSDGKPGRSWERLKVELPECR